MSNNDYNQLSQEELQKLLSLTAIAALIAMQMQYLPNRNLVDER